MANFRDIEMLNEALNNVGSSALQRKQMSAQRAAEMQKLQLETELRDLQGKRIDAYGAHAQEMENIGTQKNQILAQSESDKNKILAKTESDKVDAATAAEATKNNAEIMQQFMGALRNMPDDQASKMFKDYTSKLPPELHQKMVDSNPTYAALEAGNIKFSQLPKVDAKGNPQKQNPTDLETIEEKHDAADEIPADVDTHPIYNAFHAIPKPPTTNSPAIPAHPAYTVTRKVPVGSSAFQMSSPEPVSPVDQMQEQTPTVKSLDAKTAQAYLTKAQGNKSLARQMAVQDGFSLMPQPAQ